LSQLKLKNYRKNLKISYNAQLIKESHNKSKTTWDLVYGSINKPKSIKPALHTVSINGKTIRKPKEIANNFNNFFVDKPNELASQINKLIFLIGLHHQ
jgi:hypothetical protein